MGNISTQAVTWSGTPRVASPQYIQTAISAGSPGDTYTLLTGTHRGQVFIGAADDELVGAAGAVLNGSEDIGTGGWTDNEDGTWEKAVSISINQASAECQSGFACGDIEVMLFNGLIIPWYDTVGAVDADGCFHDGTNAVIGVDPSTLSTIEICRSEDGIRGGFSSVRGATPAERFQICGYASQSGGVGGAGIYVYDAGAPTIFRDLEIFSISGGGVGAADFNEFYNVTIRHCGQLGIFVIGPSEYPDGVIFGEGGIVHTNGIGGWDNAYEGGNSKWAYTENLIVKGSLWDIGTYAHIDGLAPMWLDINNDGYQIFGNVFRDTYHEGSRGLFLEISYSGKVRDNILIELSWNSDPEVEGWANGIIMDGSGTDATGGPHSYIYSDLEIYANLLYKCAGGIGGVQNREDYDETGSQRYGYWVNENWNIHDNTTYFDGTSGFDEEVGVFNWNVEVDAQGENLEWEDNIYITDAATTFNDDQDGGAGTGISWATWKSSGGHDDTGDRVQMIVAGDYDPNPFNGGAM